jgi:hypothetical protein
MATIKTQLVGSERRILTKNGLISCSCCEAGCCMYPANQLGTGYAQADLPDAVTINWSGHSSGSAARSGSTYAVGATTLSVSGSSWTLASGGTTQSIGGCLITGDGGFTDGDDLVEDQFADTYSVEFLVDKVVIVERESLCSWSGQEEIDGFLYEAFLRYNDETFQWEAAYNSVDISGENIVKDGDQNTPVGTYTGETTTITIFE